MRPKLTVCPFSAQSHATLGELVCSYLVDPFGGVKAFIKTHVIGFPALLNRETDPGKLPYEVSCPTHLLLLHEGSTELRSAPLTVSTLDVDLGSSSHGRPHLGLFFFSSSH